MKPIISNIYEFTSIECHAILSPMSNLVCKNKHKISFPKTFYWPLYNVYLGLSSIRSEAGERTSPKNVLVFLITTSLWVVLNRVPSHSHPLSPTPIHSQPLTPTTIHSHPLPRTSTDPHPLPSTPTHFHQLPPTLIHSHLFSTTPTYSHPLQLSTTYSQSLLSTPIHSLSTLIHYDQLPSTFTHFHLLPPFPLIPTNFRKPECTFHVLQTYYQFCKFKHSLFRTKFLVHCVLQFVDVLRIVF